MLYPQKISSQKKNKVMNGLVAVSIFLAGVLSLINKLTTPQIHWAALAIGGIIYIWITVCYAINKNTNIALHVMLQTIAIAILTTYIDYQIGFLGWSLEIAIPIILIVANATMLILTIVSHKKYIRYAIYQLIICLISLIPLYLIYERVVYQVILSYVSIGISVLNFILTIALCSKALKEAIARKFHI